MSTFLAEQLERLRVPESNVTAGIKYQVSIIFDKKEASTKDRRTIFDLGLSGLHDLIILNPTFKEFKWTLFDENTYNLERAVEAPEVNLLLNINIKRFLFHLSPYLLLRPAQLCLEWLVRRFQIHAYNYEDLLALILPYHETNIFVCILKILPIRSADKHWNWLMPIQKPGVNLSKGALLTRASSDSYFYNFVCKTTLEAINELGNKAYILQTQLNFYTAVIVGAIEQTESIHDWHITNLLPNLMKGLSTAVEDFASATYIITAQLLKRAKLTMKVCSAIIKRIAKPQISSIHRAVVLLLVLLFNSQPGAEHLLDESVMVQLISSKWFIEILSDLSREGFQIHPICIVLIGQCVKTVLSKDENAEEFSTFLDKLLDNIRFPEQSAQRVIKTFFENYKVQEADKDDKSLAAPECKKLKTDDDVINLSMDEEDEERDADSDVSEQFIHWYEKYLARLERQYPTAFDTVIKESIHNYPKLPFNYMAAIKLATGYRLNLSKDTSEDGCNLYANLYHPLSTRRLKATKKLIKGLNSYQKSATNRHILRECIWDRLNDESVDVVVEILKLNTNDIIEMIGCEKLMGNLMMIIYKLQMHQLNISDNAAQRNVIIKSLSLSIVKHLANGGLSANYDNNIQLLILMPFLYPTESELFSNDVIEEILESKLGQTMTLFIRLKLRIRKLSMPMNSAEDCRRMFLSNLFDTESNDGDGRNPLAIEFIQSVSQMQTMDVFRETRQMHNIVLLTIGFMKQRLTIDDSRIIFQTFLSLREDYCVKHIAIESWNMLSHANFIPFQLYRDFLMTLIKQTVFEKYRFTYCDWEDPENKDMQFFLPLFQMITTDAFDIRQHNENQNHWLVFLKCACNLVFNNDENIKQGFLINFFIYDQCSVPIQDYFELRLKAFHLMRCLIRKTDCEVPPCEWNAWNILLVSIGLMNSNIIIRQETIKTLSSLLEFKFNTMDINQLKDNDLKFFLIHVLQRKDEILMDSEQFSMVMYTILSYREQFYWSVVTKILRMSKEYQSLKCPYLIVNIVRLLKHFNDEEVLLYKLTTCTNILRTFTITEENMKTLKPPCNELLILTIEHINNKKNVSIYHQEDFWTFIDEVFQSGKVFLLRRKTMMSVPCLLFHEMEHNTFKQIPKHCRERLIIKCLNSLCEKYNEQFFKELHTRCNLVEFDCNIFVPILEAMMPNKRQNITGTQTIPVDSIQWRKGNIIMELMEGNGSLRNADKLLPILFDVFSYSLLSDQQIDIEFSRQLLLTTILDCCVAAKNDKHCDFQKLSQNIIRIDQIVQCLRISTNPQTLQSAILLLTHCAKFMPQQVLNNIVNIFTFMGSSVVRHDDAFSFMVIKDIITTIIPILTKDTTFLLPVLKVFSDIMQDVPDHRRSTLYICLMNTLNAKQYLWMFLCIVAEAQATHEEKHQMDVDSDHHEASNKVIDVDEYEKRTQKRSNKKGGNGKDNEELPKRIEIMFHLMKQFDLIVVLETCLKIVHYLQNLSCHETKSKPMTKENPMNYIKHKGLFDVEAHSPASLHKYIYYIIKILMSVTNSNEILEEVAEFEEAKKDMEPLKILYQNLIIEILTYISYITENFVDCSESANGPAKDNGPVVLQRSHWKTLLPTIYGFLDNIIELLTANDYVSVVANLVHYDLLAVRKRIVEIFVQKLQRNPEIQDKCNKKCIQSVLGALSRVVLDIRLDKHADIELIHFHQYTLISIQILSKDNALKYIELFTKMLKNIHKIIDKSVKLPPRSHSKILYVTLLVTMIEVMCSLRAHGLSQLPQLMNFVHRALEDESKYITKNKHAEDSSVTLTLIAGVQKLFETMPIFLGSYLVNVVVNLGAIKTHLRDVRMTKDFASGSEKSQNTQQRINSIWTQISAGMELRILIYSFDDIFVKVMDEKRFDEMKALMELVQETLRCHSAKEMVDVHDLLAHFFLHALEFRDMIAKATQNDNKRLPMPNTSDIEAIILEAFVLWSLKLSESSFRPIYHRVYVWALQMANTKETILTFFLLSKRLASAFKTLFVLFADEFVDDAARLLQQYNTVNEEIRQQLETDTEKVTLLSVQSILDTLYTIFLHDNRQFVTSQRFKMLMPAIVDQLDSDLVVQDETLKDSLRACVAQLAVDVSSDVMWKELNTKILLKTRHKKPEIRILAFECCVAIAKNLSTEFSALLPDTAPFIAELLEDENPRVEKNVKRLIQEMESYIGESIQSHL